MSKYPARRFKRIYIEITSSCNLNCSFCQETKRPKTFMSLSQFSHVIREVSDFTSFVYLHVKGEPMLHPELDGILSLCKEAGITVNITTNGTLLMKNMSILKANPPHQINISLHSADDNDCIDMDKYYKEVFQCCNILNECTPTEISLRLWTTREDPSLFGTKNFRIRDRLHVNVQAPFQWPDLENEYFNERGFCQGLRTHIAILSNGSVVPCCLDGNGCMILGNIFEQSLNDILNSDRAKAFSAGFQKKYAVEPLCKHCSFKERFGNHL